MNIFIQKTIRKRIAEHLSFSVKRKIRENYLKHLGIQAHKQKHSCLRSRLPTFYTCNPLLMGTLQISTFESFEIILFRYRR